MSVETSMTEAERKQLEAMLIAYFPTTPPATASAWILGAKSRRPDDVAKAIQAMSKATAFASAKALEDAIDEVVAARAKALEGEATQRLLAAHAGTDIAANRAKLARIAEAIARKAPREEIDAIALDGVKR